MNAFQRTLASLLAGGASLAAGPAMGQVTVNTPGGDPAAAPTNIQAGPVEVQSGPAGTHVTVAPGTGAAIGERIGENAAARQTLRQERIADREAARQDWRMQRFSGAWWYWGPSNQWSVYRNNAWTPFVAGSGLTAPPVPTPNVAPAPPATSYQVFRRGPMGLRRYSVGYGPATTVAPQATAPSAQAPAPSAQTPAQAQPQNP